MPTLKANQLKKDMFILYRGEPYEVLKCEFYFPGKGAAFARTKLKSAKSGNVAEYTYKSNDSVEIVEVETLELQYLYHESDTYFFMNPRSFEQYEVSGSILAGKGKWLKPESKLFCSLYEGQVIGVRIPPKVTLRVTEASHAVAGNTVSAAKKPVLVEGDLEVMVPLFVKTGDQIIINTEDGTYASRA